MTKLSTKKSRILQVGNSYQYIVVEPRSIRDMIEILFKFVKVPVVGNTADTQNPPGLLPF